jgi:hypothetical protein
MSKTANITAELLVTADSVTLSPARCVVVDLSTSDRRAQRRTKFQKPFAVFEVMLPMLEPSLFKLARLLPPLMNVSWRGLLGG